MHIPGLDSATAVVQLGKGAFARQLKTVAADGLGDQFADQIWNRAMQIQGMALTLLMDNSPTINKNNLFAIPHNKIKDREGDSISLEALFGALDYCECRHCQR